MEEFISEEAYRLVNYIMLGFAAFYVLFEVALNLNELENDTSNVILFEASKGKLFFIPFVMGTLMGHLFLGTTNAFFDIGDDLPVYILFGVSVLMLFVGYKWKFEKSRLFFTVLLLIGIAYGHFFWSMNLE